MRMSKLNTPLALVCAFSLALGGWFVTRRMLILREEEFLNGTGWIAMQSPEIALSTEDGEGGGAGWPTEQEDFQGESLSEEMMAKVLSAWENGGNRQLHEPKKGQMNMEQAIDAGRNWIRAIVEKGLFPMGTGVTAGDFELTDAKLFTLETQVDFDERLLSYWEIQMVKDDMDVSLTIHAASGEVWKAGMKIKRNNGLIENSDFIALLETAFPFVERPNTIWLDKEENTIGEELPEGLVYAAVKWYHIYSVLDQDALRQADVVIEFWMHTS